MEMDKNALLFWTCKYLATSLFWNLPNYVTNTVRY